MGYEKWASVSCERQHSANVMFAVRTREAHSLVRAWARSEREGAVARACDWENRFSIFIHWAILEAFGCSVFCVRKHREINHMQTISLTNGIAFDLKTSKCAYTVPLINFLKSNCRRNRVRLDGNNVSVAQHCALCAWYLQSALAFNLCAIVLGTLVYSAIVDITLCLAHN